MKKGKTQKDILEELAKKIAKPKKTSEELIKEAKGIKYLLSDMDKKALEDVLKLS